MAQARNGFGARRRAPSHHRGRIRYGGGNRRRYIDTRLGEVHNLLDEDDIFIVMSDHGIRTAMEHSRHAMFVATGRGVPFGRADGRPTLRGVSAAIADMMGVDTSWPRTGVAPWARISSSRNQTPADGEDG